MQRPAWHPMRSFDRFSVALGAMTVELSISRSYALQRDCVQSRLDRRGGPLRITCCPCPFMRRWLGSCVCVSRVSPWTLPLFFVPALAAQRLFGLYQEEREVAGDLSRERAPRESEHLVCYGTRGDAGCPGPLHRRPFRGRCDLRAGTLLSGLAYPRSSSSWLTLRTCSRHWQDRAPVGLLEKPGALTLEERKQMQEHSAIGERILAKVEDYAEIAKIVRHHHERIDGMGYPDGLADHEIPLISKILAVADAYNAMTSDRPYRDAMPSRVARMRLAQGIEGQFDTSIVAAFEAVLAGASEDTELARDSSSRLMPGRLLGGAGRARSLIHSGSLAPQPCPPHRYPLAVR